MTIAHYVYDSVGREIDKSARTFARASVRKNVREMTVFGVRVKLITFVWSFIRSTIRDATLESLKANETL